MQINHKLIDEFIANADWYSVWNEDNFSEINPEAMAKDLDYNKFNWMCGATKMVFQPVDMTENYVIKIPFRYVGDENYDYAVPSQIVLEEFRQQASSNCQ